MKKSTSTAKQHATSDAQLAANRANAQRSTGPRTPQGKARSSLNAMKHGIYARRELAIENGPFDEDPDEVSEFLRESVEALAPRDVLEMARANRIALLQLQERRLDAWEVGVLNANEAAEAFTHSDNQSASLLHVLECISVWNQRRRVDAQEADSDSESATDIGEPPWESMAYLVKSATDEDLTVADLWEDEHVPRDANEWKQAFEAVSRYVFPTWEGLAQWWVVQYTSVEQRASDARRRAAGEVSQQALQVLDRWNVVRSRITSELAKQMGLYSELQRRGIGRRGDLAKRTQYS